MDLGRLPWLAGLYEGEGSCSAVRKSPTDVSLNVRIGMTDRDVLESAQAAAGGLGRIYGPYERTEGWKPIYQWVIAVLVAMWPLLHERRRAQVSAAISAWLQAHHQRAANNEPTVRFWAKVEVAGPSDCWVWRGGLRPDGSGQFWVEDGVVVAAHYFAWAEAHGGEIPVGVNLLLPCDEPACVRPDHRRSTGDVCRNGHDLTNPENVALTNEAGRKSRRRCRVCRRATAERYEGVRRGGK